MADRKPLSQQQHDWLVGQLQAWRTAGLVGEEQAGKILALYETGDERQERRRSWLLFTLSGLVAVLFGAAVLLLVSYNWAALPAAAKLLIIFTAIVATYALGIYLRYWRAAPLASDAVLLLGCILYGAAIWLIAQIFHIRAHYPDGVFWWALGVLPLAFLLDSLLLHALLVVLVATWCGLETTQFSGLGGLLFGWRWQIPNACYQAVLVAAGGLVLAYRTNSFWRVALYAALLAWWTVIQPFAWRWHGNPVYFVGAVGALTLVIAESHASGSRLAIPYRAYGALLFGGALLPLSYWSFNKYANQVHSAWMAIGMSTAILFLAVAVFAVAEWLPYLHLERGNLPAAQRLDKIRRRQWLPLSLVALMAGLSLWTISAAGSQPAPVDAIWVPTVAANAAIIALALWLISVGLHEERGQPFAAGVLYFLLWIVIRYIDLFGELGGMLGAALMFFLCGCVLLGVILFWKNRRRVQYA
jgi:uncharacterized membrane protein